MARVILKNVSKIFEKNVTAVANVNLTVEDKEFVVLVGPSGCGKSTTLRLIAGLEELTTGEIYIDDRLVNDIPPKDRDIAMVFQNYALYPHMTVYDNMAFGLKLRKFSKQEIETRVREAAEILGIEGLLSRKPKALSGGERQRVAVGRAIVRKPKVFLLDEPLSNLDAKLRVQMRAELSKLHDRLQATIIYVTHDQVEAMTMGERIVVMKDGIIQQIADPLSLYEYPKNRFVAGFIGSPAMNFFQGRLTKRNAGFFFEERSFAVRLPPRLESYLISYLEREIVMGVRPEHFLLPGKVSSIAETAPVKAKVEVVEPMGNEIYVYLATEKTSFVAKIEVQAKPRVGQEMELYFALDRVHFFDSQTDETII